MKTRKKVATDEPAETVLHPGIQNLQFLPGPDFSRILQQWNMEKNDRRMPWKGERDPYRIWLSEIILQQTRVEQGLAYYERFIHQYPSITDLAAAPDDEVLKLWEGLGYYSRCRNLLTTARFVSNERGGVFPGTYEGILALKGVGPYTAAAISSFAFGLPHAVLDGNVYRVLSRIFGLGTPADSGTGRAQFTQLADFLLDRQRPGLHNQALMDFGATVCKPAIPLCGTCSFNPHCFAYIHARIPDFPRKDGKVKIRKRWFYYFVLDNGEETAIRQRTEKGIWQQLYEFPVIETQEDRLLESVLTEAENSGLLSAGEYRLGPVSDLMKQQLSHQLITGRFIRVRVKPGTPLPGAIRWVAHQDLARYAFPRFINQYLEQEPAS